MQFAKGTVSAVACAAVIAGASTLAFGSTFLKVDIPTLRKMSEAVVKARVVEVRSSWNAEGSAIFTYATLEVKGRLTGQAEDQLVVRIPGGTVGNFTSIMEGAPELTVGDDVVAFIARWDDGAPMIAGYAQGVSKLKTDAVGNALLHGGLADGMPISELTKQLGRSDR